MPGTTTYSPTLFPPLTTSYILSFQFSSWYPKFASKTLKSTIVSPLGDEFKDYLEQDGVMVPEGADDVCVPCFDICYGREADMIFQ